MPVNYQLPPWLDQKAAINPADAYVQSLHIGAQIGMEKSRLQQENEIARMQADAKRQEMERRAAMDAQQLEVARAYHQQQNELRLADLNQKQQLIEAQAQDAARKFTAQQRYRQRFQELTAAGIDPDQAARTAALENAGELLGPSGLNQVARPRPNYKFVPGTDQQPASWQAEGQRPVTIPRSALPQKAADIEPMTKEIPGTDLMIVSNPQTGHFVVRSKGTKTGELSTKDKATLAAKIPGMIAQVDKITDDKLKAGAMQKILDLNAALKGPTAPAESPAKEDQTDEDSDNTDEESAPETPTPKRFRYNLQTRKIEPIEGD